jgi:hypothetical protein
MATRQNWHRLVARRNPTLNERFTRKDRDTLVYEFTINDPAVWTTPGPVHPTAAATSQIHRRPPATGEPRFRVHLAGS